MSNFIIFNILLIVISSVIDYIAIDWFGLVEWSSNYIYYIFFINLPLSTFLAYYLNRKYKEL